MMILLRELEQPQTSSSPCASIIPLRRRDWTGMGVCFQSVIGDCSSRQGPRRGLTAYVQRGPWHSRWEVHRVRGPVCFSGARCHPDLFTLIV